jgi:transposase InsO family protein
MKMITWKGTATLLRNNLFKRFGLPDKIISDRDLRFAAHTLQELLKLLNIKSNLTTAYHPQLDGATERVNQEIEAYLSIYCTLHSEDWLHLLSTLEFTHNN